MRRKLALLLTLVLTLAACGGAPLTAEQCDRVDEFYAGRMAYVTTQMQVTPTQAHLAAYAVQFLVADELRRNPLSESIFTARDVQACRAGG